MSDREDGLALAGARLRKWREDEGITQAVAAERLRSSQGTWAAWERGDKGPDLHFAFEIERLTSGAVSAVDWAFPRKGSRAADESGSLHAVDAPKTGTEGV